MSTTQQKLSWGNRSGHILEVAEPVLELWEGVGTSAPRRSPQLGARSGWRSLPSRLRRSCSRRCLVSVGTLGGKTSLWVSMPEIVRISS